MRFAVLTGLAGVGKTDALTALAARGHPVVDLEGLARHRGSAFGGIGLPPQPSQREFDDQVTRVLASCDPQRWVWMEDEGPFLGAIRLPLHIVDGIKAAPTVHVARGRSERLSRLARTYGGLDPQALVQATRRIAPRLGRQRAREAIRQFQLGNPERAIDVLLPYFDDAYEYRRASFHRTQVMDIRASSCTDEAVSDRLQDAVDAMA